MQVCHSNGRKSTYPWSYLTKNETDLNSLLHALLCLPSSVCLSVCLSVCCVSLSLFLLNKCCLVNLSIPVCDCVFSVCLCGHQRPSCGALFPLCSLLLPRGPWRLNSGRQTWQQDRYPLSPNTGSLDGLTFDDVVMV